MSAAREERLGRLAEALQELFDAHASIDVAAMAERFEVAEADVQDARQALLAVHDCLAEDAGGGHRASSAGASSALAAPPQLPADYEVGEELGRGGMGIVYRARQRSLDRELAVKVLRPGDIWFADRLARFEREAKSLARLRHRHIVTVHEVGQSPDGFVYFTMDLIQGETLEQLVREGRMTATRAVRLLRQVASAVAYAHGRGVVHRDLKPQNILVDANDDAFVVDFGLALDAASGGDATRSGQLIGTPAYMSPEQALGDRERTGEASDIYSLGAVLYFCMAGRAPFGALPVAQLMHALIEREPEPLRKRVPTCPQDLEVICHKAMAKEIDERYATVQAFGEDLERFAGGDEILARPRSRTSKALRVARRHSRLIAVSGALLVVLLGALLFWVLPAARQERSLTIGAQLLQEGNHRGAMLAYRTGFDGLDAGGAAAEHRVGFVRCLIDEAARLQLAPGVLTHDREQRVAAMVAEARGVLTSFGDLDNQWRAQQAISPAAYADAVYEQARLQAFDPYPEREDLPHALAIGDRLTRDLAGAGRWGGLMLVAAVMQSELWWEQHLELPRTLPDLLRAVGRLPGPAAMLLQRWVGMFESGTSAPTRFRSRELEDGLADVLGDTSLHDSSRQIAALILQRLGVLPTSARTERVDVPGGFTAVAVFDERDLQRMSAAYETLRTLGRLEEWRFRIDYVVESIRLAAEADHGGALGRGDLVRWLRLWTGRDARRLEEFEAWWRKQPEAVDPRTWLLDALRWDVERSSLTPASILEKWREDRRRAANDFLLHGLMTLTVDRDVPVPLTVGFGHRLPASWRMALGVDRKETRRLRLLSLMLVPGEKEPRVFSPEPIELQPDTWQPVALTIDAGSMPAAPVWVPRNHVEAEGVKVFGNAHLQYKDGQAQLQIVYRAVGNGVWSEMVGGSAIGFEKLQLVGSGWKTSRDRQTHAGSITLAYHEPASADSRRWTLEDWREAIVASVEDVLAQPDAKVDQGQAAGVASSFLPFTGDLETLRRFCRLPSKKSASWRSGQRDSAYQWPMQARLLAGDPEASIEVTERDPALLLPFAVRLLQVTKSESRRSELLELLASSEEMARPSYARALHAVAASGVAVPASLLAKYVPSSAWSILWQDHKWDLLRLACTLAVIAFCLCTMFRLADPTARRWRAFCLWIMTFLLMPQSLIVYGVDCNPVWFALGLNVLAVACWYWRALPTWVWVLPPVAWAAAQLHDVLTPGPLPFGEWLAVGALMSLMSGRVGFRESKQVVAERRQRRLMRQRRIAARASAARSS
ncbi:MAG: protein kinase [Planctomycetota bacterium]